MSVVADDDGPSARRRTRVCDAPSGERPRLRMPRCVLVQRSRRERRAHRLELFLSRDDERGAERHLVVPFRGARAQSTTQYTGTGWLLPLSSIGGQATSFGGDNSACFVSSVMRICPASAAEQGRWAVFTVSPRTVTSSRRSEPMFPANASP